jgi:RNA polymerase sigma-70 factor (ECF subfamily)
MLKMQPKSRPQIDRRHDIESVNRVLAGDPDAFTEIYNAYFRRVYAFMMKRVSNTAEIEDLTQETFVQLYRSLPSYEGRSSLLTWTFGIANNVAARYFRHCSRWMVGSDYRRPLDDRPVEATIERRVDAKRVLKRCDKVLQKSRRPAHQQIFHLRYGKNRSVRSIAEATGKSTDAVKVSLRRSRTALAAGVPELKVVLENVAQSA